MTVIDRLFAKVEEQGECWVFTGAETSAGYGSISLGTRAEGRESTHVVSYQFFVGEIPEGLTLDHLCRVLLCCNPAHLEAVPRKVNTERGTRHSATHCDNGHERTEENTMLRRDGKKECRECYRAASMRRYYARKIGGTS